MKAISKARILGWLQFVVTYLNGALSQNGGAIPTNKSQWLNLFSSLVVAAGIHISASTSAGHPDGPKTANKQQGFARISVLPILALLSALLFVACRHQVNSTNPAVISEVNLLNARKTVNTIAHGLKSANDTVKGLSATEADYYTFVHPKLVQVAQLNDKADGCITQAEAGGTCDWKSAISLIAQSTGDPAALTTFGFKNPKTQETVVAAFNDLIAGIKLAAAFGGH